jgi:LysR family transcriptional regulator, regulator of gene expression of beta-lactamase
VRAFDIEVDTGSYWLTWLKSKRVTPAMQAFTNWIVERSAS